MHEGHIKLFRRVQKHELWKEKPFTRGQAWIDMLLSANHQECSYEASQRFLAARWGWSQKKVRAFLSYLVRNEMIKLDTRGAQVGAQVGTQISILNYNKFHSGGAQVGNQVGAQRQEIKNKNIKQQYEKILSGKDFHFCSIGLAYTFLEGIQRLKPDFKSPTDKTMLTWIRDFNLMLKIDGRQSLLILKVMKWARAHSFWQSNILCPAKLRKQFDQLEMKMAGKQ